MIGVYGNGNVRVMLDKQRIIVTKCLNHEANSV